MAQKLIKVAKEFNVGLHTIVETLHSKGFPIEEKPTADITDEMLIVLQKEFQKDLAIKQEADKLARPVLKKDPVSPSVGAPATTATTAAPPAARPSLLPPREEAPKVALPKIEEAREVKPAAQKEEPEVIQRERPALRVIGRIDLDAANKPQAPKPEEKKAEAPTAPPTAEPVTTPAPEPEKPVVAPVTEQKPAAQTPAPEPSKPTNKPAQPESSSGTDTPAEESEMYRADAPQLRGLKILGRISLDKPKPEPSSGNRNQQGGGNRNQQGGGNRNQQGGGNRNQQGGGNQHQGQQNRPANAGGGGQGEGNSNDPNRHKRKRKKVQQPVTAASLQASMSGGGSGGGDRRGTGGGGRRDDQPKEVSQKQIEDQIRQTMARMGAGASRKRQKIRRDKRDERRERAELAEMERSEGEKVLQVTEFISVSDLAALMNVKPADVIKACMSLGIFVSINQRLDAELIEVVASEFNYEVQFISAEEQVEVEEEEIDDPKDLVPRQPIVTVMGHVDHGKTSLLDFIRSANVAEGEAGGITQHIGAYEVKVNDDHEITFLDTPGHEAFTAMRARGAKVTDIAIIVIAADDSIMPQTREAISHAQAAGVPIVFAINKIDKPGADPERIKNELAQMNLLVEEWGGKYQSQDISAKKGVNVDKLLEKVLLEAELLELKANPSRRAIGTVLEASLDKGRGYVTKMLVENGTLHDGDPIIAGEFAGKVKAMFNERGKKIKEAGPATPVLVLGLPGAPQAGEKIKEARSESEAKEIASKRAQIIREQSNRASKRISLEEIGRRLALGNFKELNLIVKGDVDGSIEALSDSLIKLSMEKIQVNVIHKAVGQIVDSDVMLASASDAIIIGFQVRPSLTARKLAEKEGVEIKMYSIIYEAIEEIKAAMEGMLEPTKEEEIMGQVEVREVYKISKVGTVAGCFVQEGKISRNHYIRIVRDGIVVYPGNANQNAELASLKRFKEDAKEVKAGLECGITIKNFNDVKVGDIIESYVINEVKTTLR
ncbi:MAG: translation initiation factor IF-2 [Bacteroidetes bacterium]|nr:translation initiation factor IF-2 [Bacteroidota bacterium]